jgi:hypothetical protein
MKTVTVPQTSIVLDQAFFQLFTGKCVADPVFADTFFSVKDRQSLRDSVFNDLLAPWAMERGMDITLCHDRWDFLKHFPKKVGTFSNALFTGVLKQEEYLNFIQQSRVELKEKQTKIERQTAIIAELYREEIPTRATELDDILSGRIPPHNAVKLTIGVPADKLTLAQAMVHLIMVAKKGIDFSGFNSFNPLEADERRKKEGKMPGINIVDDTEMPIPFPRPE